ncbi:hypothetical protein PQQ87_16020 [Paraburkholderia nemoris]|uniref:hypothetical protein n=1 Tax=Paraburkholderia nemoris TaxID=2793076 RepID=UPI0038B74158
MPHEIRQPDIEKLRAATLKNNIVWLESFGCTATASGGFVRVSHPELPDFTAWMVTDSKPETRGAFAHSLSGSTLPDGFSIYVDDLVDVAEFPGLTTARLLPDISRVHTVTVQRNAIHASGPIAADEVGPESLPLWVGLYGEGFDRNPEQRDLDARRWTRSMRDRHLRHWLFVENGVNVGVAQTCDSAGVTGIYSFTLRPQYRQSGRTRFAVSAIVDKILGQEQVATLYFERVSVADSRPPRRGSHSGRIIRSYGHYVLTDRE